MTWKVLLPLACLALTLGALVGALVYFNVRERRESRQTQNPGGNRQGRGRNQQRGDHQ